MSNESRDLSADAVPVPAPSGIVHSLSDELLIYVPERSTTIHFNQTMALVWGLCDGRRSVGEIVAALEEAYPEAREEIEADVLEAFGDLIRSGAVKTG